MNTKGEIIETIEKGKTSAQIKREKQKEEADIKRAYEELVRKYGKEWVQYVEKGNHPKVGMPEGLLDYYPAVVTDGMGDTKRYRIFLGNGRHFHVWCHNGKVSSVHY